MAGPVPADQLLVSRTEDLHSSPERTYADVLDHLRLRPKPNLVFGPHNLWTHQTSQLTRTIRARLEARFAEPTRICVRCWGGPARGGDHRRGARRTLIRIWSG